VLAVVGCALVAGCSARSGSATSAVTASSANAAKKPIAISTTVQVSVSACGQGWVHPVPGAQTFILHNTDISAGEVSLTDAKTGAVYAEVDNVGPSARANMVVNLGAGQYALRCAMEDSSVVTGPTVTITGTAKTPLPPVLPVTQADLIRATQAYESYVRAQLPGLVSASRKLAADLSANKLARARADWLPAHLIYERLGAAYGTFADADAAINGLPDGLPAGVNDKSWTGFHRIEYGLWGGATATSLVRYGTGLVTAETALEMTFQTAQIPPLDMSIRAHEITENALEFELTGRTDYGSHSNLATVQANLDGTREVLGLLTPLLTPRLPSLPAVKAELSRATADVAETRRAGRWTPLGQLSTSQREHINADISELSEQLAPIASILEPRRTQ
jgi:iron uptake system component EfeO